MNPEKTLLLSFLPYVEKLTSDQKLDFQCYVLQFFKNIQQTPKVPNYNQTQENYYNTSVYQPQPVQFQPPPLQNQLQPGPQQLSSTLQQFQSQLQQLHPLQPLTGIGNIKTPQPSHTFYQPFQQHNLEQISFPSQNFIHSDINQQPSASSSPSSQ